MAFSAALSLCLFCAAGLLAMLLADGSLWARQNQWLLPVFFWAACLFALLAVITTRWFRHLLGYIAISKEQIDQKSIGQQTNGKHSSNFAVGSGNMTVQLGSHTPTVQPVPTQQKARPNLVYKGFREAQVFISPWWTEGVREPNDATEETKSSKAIVIKFDNEPLIDQAAGNSSDVTAKIVYKTTGRNVRVDYGVWLDSTIRHEYFEVGDTKELLIAVIKDGKFVILDDKRKSNSYFQSEYSYIRVETIDILGHVDVTLVDRQSGRYDFCFTITYNADGLNVDVADR